MNPARGKLFVKPVDTTETLPGGKILLTDHSRADLTASQMEVVAMGEFAICEDGDCEHMHTHPVGISPTGAIVRWHPFTGDVGDWVLLAPRSLTETDRDGIFCVAQDAVIARLEP